MRGNNHSRPRDSGGEIVAGVVSCAGERGGSSAYLEVAHVCEGQMQGG